MLETLAEKSSRNKQATARIRKSGYKPVALHSEAFEVIKAYCTRHDMGITDFVEACCFEAIESGKVVRVTRQISLSPVSH